MLKNIDLLIRCWHRIRHFRSLAKPLCSNNHRTQKSTRSTKRVKCATNSTRSPPPGAVQRKNYLSNLLPRQLDVHWRHRTSKRTRQPARTNAVPCPEWKAANSRVVAPYCQILTSKRKNAKRSGNPTSEARRQSDLRGAGCTRWARGWDSPECCTSAVRTPTTRMTLGKIRTKNAPHWRKLVAYLCVSWVLTPSLLSGSGYSLLFWIVFRWKYT